MSFAENLQMIRKEKHLSQEELAEMLGVSRQAVSKWEQGTGYPEVEKLLLLSRELNLSLDSLMATEIAQGKAMEPDKVTGVITILSPHEHVVTKCYKVIASQKFKGGKKIAAICIVWRQQYRSIILGRGKYIFGMVCERGTIGKGNR